MNYRAIFKLVAFVLLVMGAAQTVCALLAVPLGDAPGVRENLLHAAAAVLLAGAAALFLARGGAAGLSGRDGFGVVVFGWLSAALAGAAPYFFTGAIPGFTDAFFESMSGLTTTGATVVASVEALPRAVLLWRAMTQFFGGMGVLVLVVAILPQAGAAGMSLFRAEMTGPVKTRLTPRIATTAKLLWLAYAGLTALEIPLLRLAGMPWFDSVCHAFATLSSGGFAVRDAGLAAYNSPFVEAVVVCFMLLSGVNFALLVLAFRGEFRSVWRDSEFRFYLLAWLLLCAFFTCGLALATPAPFFGALRAAAFTVTSTLTTTGFAIADYDAWPGFLRLALFCVFFTGGCAGSTSGSVKMVRILAVCKFMAREIRRWILPRAVMPVKINDTPLDGNVLNTILGFVLLFLIVFAAGAVLMSPFFPDPVSAVSASATALCNYGPGFNVIGPSHTFAAVAPAGKLLLAFLMLLGRLELYTVLVLFVPTAWKK